MVTMSSADFRMLLQLRPTESKGKATPQKPKTFDGKAPKVQYWYHTFTNYMRLCNNPRSEWSGLLLSYTSPEVATFLEGHFRATRRLAVRDVPVEEVRALLFATYADFAESRRLACTLHQQRQNAKTPMAYITEFDLTLGLITAADRPREYQIIQHFVNGFNNARFREFLINQDFPNYVACRNFAKDALLRNPMYSGTSNWQRTGDSPGDNAPSDRSRLKRRRDDRQKSKDRQFRHVDKRSKGNFKRPGAPGTCWTCGETGHMSSQCPKRDKRRNPAPHSGKPRDKPGVGGKKKPEN
jgi:hypothetical protein